MSASGTGIGYSLATIAPTLTLIETRFLLGALACWAVSFLFGLKVLQGLQTAIGLSKTIVTGQKEASMMRPEFQKQIADLISEQTNSLGNKQSFFQYWQLALPVIGAFLLVWTKIDILKAIEWPT